jgi:hypothetical protein
LRRKGIFYRFSADSPEKNFTFRSGGILVPAQNTEGKASRVQEAWLDFAEKLCGREECCLIRSTSCISEKGLKRIDRNDTKGTRTLRTRRLVLRRFTVEDARSMFGNWANDKEVTKYLTGSRMVI